MEAEIEMILYTHKSAKNFQKPPESRKKKGRISFQNGLLLTP
jgi:hypothetical protein